MHNERDLVLVSKLSAPYITLCDFSLRCVHICHKDIQHLYTSSQNMRKNISTLKFEIFALISEKDYA